MESFIIFIAYGTLGMVIALMIAIILFILFGIFSVFFPESADLIANRLEVQATNTIEILSEWWNEKFVGKLDKWLLKKLEGNK